jgi:rare lipoprotein A
MRRQLTLIFSLILAFTAGYGQSPTGPRSAKPAKVQYGTASFYADKFEGRQTATGEIFTQQKMTAAHNTLPLGTWIRVTNLSNKRAVVVRINDRLHPKNPRLVDLSKTAAKKLGYTGQGLTRVRVEVLGKKEPQQDLAAN